MQKISIDPITRLEGHGRIDIFLNDVGDVANAYMVIPELRGFEKFAEGRRVEEMNDITPRICGVCPEAHHMAATKACDAVYHVDRRPRPRDCASCSTPRSTSPITPSTSTSWPRRTSSWDRTHPRPSAISWA